MSGERITELWAFVALDPVDDAEGVCSMQTGAVHLPLIGGDEARIRSLHAMAQQIADRVGASVELRRFTSMERVYKLEPGAFTCPDCGWTSWHPDDRKQGYCGHCHRWIDTPGVMR